MTEPSSTRKLVERVLNSLTAEERANVMRVVAEIGEFSMDSAYWYPFLMGYKTYAEMKKKVEDSARSASAPVAEQYSQMTTALAAFSTDVQIASAAVSQGAEAIKGAAMSIEAKSLRVVADSAAQLEDRVDKKLSDALPRAMEQVVLAAARAVSENLIPPQALAKMLRPLLPFAIAAALLFAMLFVFVGYQWGSAAHVVHGSPVAAQPKRRSR